METLNKETEIYKWFRDAMLDLGMSEHLISYARAAVLCLIVLLVAKIAHWIFSKYVVKVIEKALKKTKTKHDDVFIERKLFKNIGNIIPAIVIYTTLNWVFREFDGINNLLHNVVSVYFIIAILLIVQSFLRGLTDIYESFDYSKDRPIRSYVQTIMLLFTVIGILIIISILFDVKLTKVFTGIGATAAVIMLVFKDTILGFVASIQLSANNMVKPGDWISMPSQGADGTVLEITLNTVKVQNWDKTITTIPTYALVSNSFSNWKGMEESGGRRIKRSINVDMKSVKFCTEEMIEKYGKVHLLNGYMQDKSKEIKQYNASANIDESVFVNGRRMTNLGVFRAYLESYLRQHPKIHDGMTFLVRHLQPNEKGLPIEIYVFSTDQAWSNYESIQADIFDHILAVIPEFELKVFQYPTEVGLAGLS